MERRASSNSSAGRTSGRSVPRQISPAGTATRASMTVLSWPGHDDQPHPAVDGVARPIGGHRLLGRWSRVTVAKRACWSSRPSDRTAATAARISSPVRHSSGWVTPPVAGAAWSTEALPTGSARSAGSAAHEPPALHRSHALIPPLGRIRMRPNHRGRSRTRRRRGPPAAPSPDGSVGRHECCHGRRARGDRPRPVGARPAGHRDRWLGAHLR